jgi:hypothetical protein
MSDLEIYHLSRISAVARLTRFPPKVDSAAQIRDAQLFRELSFRYVQAGNCRSWIDP